MKHPGMPMLVRCTACFLRCSVIAASLAALAGCGGSPTAPSNDEVFYLHGAGILDKNYSYEVYFPPLDAGATERVPRVVGVGVLEGDVRLGRPIDWYVRAADYSPQSRYISYQSPRQFLFSIFERIDNPEDPWPEVLKRYEADLDEQGAQILSGRTPVSTANGQGRSYFLKAKIQSKPPYEAYAHEVLVRSPHRILLVQIVHQQNVEASVDEMMAALRSIVVY
jgi:hypothetical protein